MDPYRTLGIPRSATSDQIREAYRAVIRSAHPDAGGDPERAAAINAAHAILADPRRRAEWDRRNPDPEAATASSPPAARRRSRPAPPPARPAAPSRPGPAVYVVGAAAVALVGILYATLSSPPPDAGDDSPFVVDVGDCVDLDRGVPIDVPCDTGSADGEVVAFGPDCPDGTDLLTHPDGADVCLDPFPVFEPAACVAIVGTAVRPVECGPNPDGVVSEVVADPSDCPVGTDAVATIEQGSYACLVIP